MKLNVNYLQDWNLFSKEEYDEIVKWSVEILRELSKAPKTKVYTVRRNPNWEVNNVWKKNPEMNKNQSQRNAEIENRKERGQIFLGKFNAKVEKLAEPFVFKLPPEVEDKCVKSWDKVLVGNFISKEAPKFDKTKEELLKLWGEEGLIKVTTNNHGRYFLSFKQETNIEKILASDHIHIQQQCMKLYKWKEGSSYDSPPDESVQIWFRLNNIPPHMYNPEALSHFASLLGKPLYMDKLTEESENLEFARLSIEVHPRSILPASITVLDRNDRAIKMGIQYEWRPFRCSTCNTFKHGPARCPKAVQIQKVVQQVENKKVSQEENRKEESKPREAKSSNMEWVEVKRRKGSSKKKDEAILLEESKADQVEEGNKTQENNLNDMIIIEDKVGEVSRENSIVEGRRIPEVDLKPQEEIKEPEVHKENSLVKGMMALEKDMEPQEVVMGTEVPEVNFLVEVRMTPEEDMKAREEAMDPSEGDKIPQVGIMEPSGREDFMVEESKESSNETVQSRKVTRKEKVKPGAPLNPSSKKVAKKKKGKKNKHYPNISL